jgi:hypothetical protein
MLKKFLLIVLFCIFSSIVLATYGINGIEYPKEILIETGWTKYFNIIVTNNGDANLNNVTIYFDGEFPQWLEVQTEMVSILQPKGNASFLVKIITPSSADAGAYPFTLYVKSNEISDSKSFSVRVFKSKADEMLYQVQTLEFEVEDAKRNATIIEGHGKNVTNIMQILNEAQNYLDASKDYINEGNDKKATELMINAENLIKEANYDMSVAPSKTFTASSYEFPPELIVMIAAPIAATISIIFYNKKSKKKETIVKPIVKIKEIVLEGRDVKNLENELKGIENSRNLLEEEFKENLLSKESRDELKEKYERRIVELKAEIERNRKIA